MNSAFCAINVTVRIIKNVWQISTKRKTPFHGSAQIARGIFWIPTERIHTMIISCSPSYLQVAIKKGYQPNNNTEWNN